MVSRGVVLLTVSTLAIYITSTVSQEPVVVHHACRDKAFCHIKPDNYPQEEIDRLVIKNLPHLHRMKRSAPPLPSRITASSPEFNCATKPIEMKPPYTYMGVGKVPYFVVQSKWFQQVVPKVSCRNANDPCFTNLTTTHVAYCHTMKASLTVHIYEHNSRKIITMPTFFDVDCVCAVAND